MSVKSNLMNLYVGIVLLFISALLFYFSLNEIGWAAYINCANRSTCAGTPGNDIIFGFTFSGVIHGFEGNDIIIGYPFGDNFIYGDSGNDILIGGNNRDSLFGGLGDDRMEGGLGDDTIFEGGIVEERFEGNDDISGGPGNDYIAAGGGSDRIFGGPGNDLIGPSSYNRDFAKDEVDCGSGTDSVNQFYSGDGDTAAYCETIDNLDG